MNETYEDAWNEANPDAKPENELAVAKKKADAEVADEYATAHAEMASQKDSD